MGYLVINFLNPTVVNIYEDKAPTKIKLQNSEVDKPSKYIYEYIFKNQKISENNNSALNNDNNLKEKINYLKDYLDFIIENNTNNLFNVLDIDINLIEFLDNEDMPNLIDIALNDTSFIAESHYALSLDEAIKVANEFANKYSAFLNGKNICVRKIKIKNKFAFVVTFIGFSSSQDARKFCKRMYINKDSCVVVESNLDDIQYIITNDKK